VPGENVRLLCGGISKWASQACRSGRWTATEDEFPIIDKTSQHEQFVPETIALALPRGKDAAFGRQDSKIEIEKTSAHRNAHEVIRSDLARTFKIQGTL
jgi:hypothetical protein